MTLKFLFLYLTSVVFILVLVEDISLMALTFLMAVLMLVVDPELVFCDRKHKSSFLEIIEDGDFIENDDFRKSS